MIPAPARSDTTEGSGTAVAVVDAWAADTDASPAHSELAEANVSAIKAKRVFMRGNPVFTSPLFWQISRGKSILFGPSGPPSESTAKHAKKTRKSDWIGPANHAN